MAKLDAKLTAPVKEFARADDSWKQVKQSKQTQCRTLRAAVVVCCAMLPVV
jgi:hypothetical protein